MVSTIHQVSHPVLVDTFKEMEDEWEADADERHRALALHPFNVSQRAPYSRSVSLAYGINRCALEPV